MYENNQVRAGGYTIRRSSFRIPALTRAPSSAPASLNKPSELQRVFAGSQSVPTLEIPGRWSETDQPQTDKPYASTAPLAETTLGLGESKIVDIAYISGVDGQCYAWNNDNYKYPAFQNPNHLLTQMGYMVNIRLRGKKVDETYRFSFDVSNGKSHFTQPQPVNNEET